MLRGTIYVAHHRPFWIYKSSLFQPVHAGRKIAKSYDPQMEELGLIGDDTEDHISHKNPSYSEMTVIYWAWKNRPPGDFVGSLHYRLYLNTSLNCNSNICFSEIDLLAKAVHPSSFINEQNISQLMSEYDLVLPLRSSLDGRSLAEDSRNHHPYWDLLMEVLLEKHPDHRQIIYDTCHAAKGGYMENRFIMRDHLFQEYADWIFPILFEMEKKVPETGRIIGYIAEPLLNPFLAIKNQETRLKIKELPSVFIKDL